MSVMQSEPVKEHKHNPMLKWIDGKFRHVCMICEKVWDMSESDAWDEEM